MKCDICEKEIGNTMVHLPIKRPNGALNTLACLECVKKSSAYCLKHETVHLGFKDGTTACLSCVSELMAEKNPEVEAIFNEIEGGLLPKEFGRLIGWAEASTEVTGLPVAIYALRTIATKALRLRIPFDEVKKRILEAKSVDLIFLP